MARAKLFRASQHGVAAVEFALVVPSFLALLGATVYFGLALYTKFLVTNAANAAVRNCVIKQVGWYSESQFLSCAASEFTSFIGSGNLGNMQNLCSGSAPTVTSRSFPVANGTLANSVRMLTLQVNCTVAVGAITWESAAGRGASTTLPLVATSSMPYALNLQTNN